MRPTLVERVLVSVVHSGEWVIDENGRIWRGSRRAEKTLTTGYLMVRKMIAGRRHVGLAHRLVWQFFNGNIPPGMVINHKNGLKDCNAPGNLEVVSYSGNTRHAYRVGLMDEHGERNPAAKLSDHDVGLIRAAYAAGGVTMAELAARFGVVFQTISDIVRGKSRRKQAGPVQVTDLRHAATSRDALGRFTRQFPRCSVTATAIDGPVPYEVRCTKPPGHSGDHRDEYGFRLPELTKARTPS